jgi:hypothetical protein
MVLPFLYAFGVGMALVFLVSLQTRLVTEARRTTLIFFVAYGISSIWGLGIQAITHDKRLLPVYALGAAIGTVVATKIRLKGRT